MLRMLMFGKPGAGKGTLSTRLINKYDISFVSCGDLLRGHINERTKIGTEVERIMARGDLVPDQVITGIVTEQLDRLEKQHWILDGFPRTQAQGILLDTHLGKTGHALSLIVELDVDDSIIIKRITDRWIHPSSGRVYNAWYNKPQVPGKDDITGEPLVQRADDSPEIFARRLQNYYASTRPLMTYFRGRQNDAFHVVSLNGETSDEIWPQLVAILKQRFPLQERVLR